MTPFRLVLVVAIVATGAWFSFKSPPAADSDSPSVARQEATYDEEGNIILGPGVNRTLRQAPDAARKLGIAKSNFIPSNWDGAEEPEIIELSYKDRRLKEKFQTTGLKRIGNSAVFSQPKAEKPTGRRRRVK